MSTPVPVPYTESRPLPDYRALLAVDAKNFTGMAAIQHSAVSRVIPEIVDQALDLAGLPELRHAKYFPNNTGDGIVFGYDPVHLPSIVWPFLRVLDGLLGRYNSESPAARIRLRASVHVGPLPEDGNGTPRNDTHRLLDSQPVKAVLASADERSTHLAAIISERVYQDVVEGGYVGLPPGRFIEVPATVEGKNFAQRAWLLIPSPSGNLIDRGILAPNPAPEPEPAAEPAGEAKETTKPAISHRTYENNQQHVRDGVANLGDIHGGITFGGRGSGQ